MSASASFRRRGSGQSKAALKNGDGEMTLKRNVTSGFEKTHRPVQSSSRRIASTSSISQKQRISSQTSKPTQKVNPKPEKNTVEIDEEDGITFVNVESENDNRAALQRPAKTLSAEEILARCEETDYRNVYEVNLRASDLTEVPNLEKFLKVRVVDLSSNHLKAISKLECCSELRELKLYDNEIEVIEKMDSISDLNHLQLQHNKIKCVGRGLVNCRKLQTLRLDWNKMIRLEGKEIASLSKLTALDLSNNKLDDITAVNALPNLQELSVSNNRLRTIEITRCKKIQELDLSGNRITQLNCLVPHSGTLQILNLSRNAISKLELSSPLSKLEELYLSHNSIKRLTVVPQRFPALQLLDLSHNQIQNDKELLCLSECECLRELDLSNNPFDLDEQGRVATNPAEIIPTLQVLDRMVLKKQGNDHRAPLMRPMSASHVISSRQVQSHILSLEAEMKNLQQSLEDKFRELRKNVDLLPSQPNSRMGSADRPPTRSSRRSRIQEAKAFASNRYTD